MSRPTSLPRLARAALLATLVAAGCGDDPQKPQPRPLPQGAAADFALVDVNPTSPTHDRTLGPRLFLGQISAWYFGHST